MLYITYVYVCTRLTNKEDEACILFPMFPRREREESIGNVKSTVAKMRKNGSSVVLLLQKRKRRKRNLDKRQEE